MARDYSLAKYVVRLFKRSIIDLNYRVNTNVLMRNLNVSKDP